MIFITDQVYADMAINLFAGLQEDESFFNGKLEYDTEQFYSTLTCSLIIYRSDPAGVKPEVPDIQKILPVWWDFSTCSQGLSVPNDFSWTEFSSFFPCHG